MSAIEDKPVVVATEEVVAAPAPVVESAVTPAETETVTAVVAENTETAEAPAVVPATEDVAAVEEPTEEVVALEPITQGSLRYKGPALFSFGHKAQHFYLGSEPVDLKTVTSGKPAVSSSIIAWASVTGAGLLFGSDAKDGPILHTFPLANFTLNSVKKAEFTLTAALPSKKVYSFIAEDGAHRDAWVAGLTAAKTEAETKKAEIEGDAKYAETIQSLTPVVPVVESTAPVLAPVVISPEETTETKAVEEETPATTEVPETAPVATVTPKTNKRNSIFGNMLSFVRPSTEVPPTEPIAATTEEAPVAPEESAPAVVEEAAATETTEDAPVEASKEVKAEKVSRRSTVLGFLNILKDGGKPKSADTAVKAVAEEAPVENAPVEDAVVPADAAAVPEVAPTNTEEVAVTDVPAVITAEVVKQKTSFFAALKNKASKSTVTGSKVVSPTSDSESEPKSGKKRFSVNLFRPSKPEVTPVAAVETADVAPVVPEVVTVTEPTVEAVPAAVEAAAEEVVAPVEVKEEVVAATVVPVVEAEKPATTA